MQDNMLVCYVMSRATKSQ